MKKHVFRKLFSLAIAALPLVGMAQRVSLPYGYAACGGMSYCPNTYLPGWMAVDPDQPVQHATFLIENPDFSSGADGWTCPQTLTVTDGQASMSGVFDVYQELEGIPNGVYELSVYGFYDGEKSPRCAWLYAGNNTMALKSKAEGSGDLLSGDYTRTVRTIVINHSLRIGVKGIYNNTYPVSFDNFRLSYVGKYVVGFEATIAEGYGTDETPEWTAGDEVSIYEGTAAYKYKALDDGAITTLVADNGNLFPRIASYYTAAYPESMAGEGSTLTLPALQEYVEGGIAHGAAPMAAKIENASVPFTFTFKNVCGLLQLNLKGSVKVSNIQINADESLCGTGSLSFDDDGNPTWNCTGGGNSLTLNCGENGVELNPNSATPFHIVAPAETLVSGFTMTVTTIDNVVKTYAYGSSPILRSGITVTEAIDIDDFTAAEYSYTAGPTAGPTVSWTTNEKIALYAGETRYEYNAVSVNNGTATFRSMGNEPLSGPYTAVHPFESSSYENGVYKLTLLPTQSYAENGIASSANPAMAQGSGKSLDFKNVCGLLKLNLRGGGTVTAIQVTSKAEESLCGTGTLDFNDGNPTWSCTGGENSLTLDCGTSGVQLSPDEDTPFHIVAPVGTLSSGFTLAVTTTEGGATVTKTYDFTGDYTITSSGIKEIAAPIDIDDFTAANYGYTNGPTVNWTMDEKIALYAGDTRYEYKAVSVSEVGTATFRSADGNEPLSGPYTAVHPCASSSYTSGTYKLTIPQEQSYVANGVASGANPAMAQSDGKSLDFKNVCGLLKLNLTGDGDNVSVRTVSVKANGENVMLWGAGTLVKDGNNPKWIYNDNGGDSVALVVPDDEEAVSLVGAATPFYIALPPANYSDGLTVTVTDGTDDNTCTIELGATTITRSAVTTPETQEVVYAKILDLMPTAMGLGVGGTGVISATVLPASSTVTWSSNNTSVATVNPTSSSTTTVTAKATGTATITATASNGLTATCTVTVAPEGAIPGLFTVSSGGNRVYFSKGNLWYDKTPATGSPWGFEAHQYDFRTYPNCGSMLNGTYNTSSGTPADTYGLFGFGDAPINGQDINTSTSDSDYSWPDSGDPWGNKIGVGWRTLTSDEWGYIIHLRDISNTSCKRFAKATVVGVPGLILFPDNTTGTTVGGVTINSANSTNAGCATNIIKASDWSKMEAAGCVFLPCTGDREGTDVRGAGSNGNYWSSSVPYYQTGRMLVFSNETYSYFGTETNCSFYNGRSVRLVYPCP